MIQFPIHTTDTAPDEARSTLADIEEDFGFIPNLFGELADAPPALDAYLSLDERFGDTTFDARERAVVLLAASRANECDYCIAAHSADLAKEDFPRDEIEKLREAQPLADERLEALRRFTHTLVEQRGHLENRQVDEFLNAGFERRQVLEVMLGVALKTFSNYVNHIVDTPLDGALSEFAWGRETAAAGA